MRVIGKITVEVQAEVSKYGRLNVVFIEIALKLPICITNPNCSANCFALAVLT